MRLRPVDLLAAAHGGGLRLFEQAQGADQIELSLSRERGQAIERKALERGQLVGASAPEHGGVRPCSSVLKRGTRASVQKQSPKDSTKPRRFK
jgi:hypothetical protein